MRESIAADMLMCKGNLVFAVGHLYAGSRLYLRRWFSGNILLDIKTTRHIGPMYYLLESLFILEGVARLGTRLNVVLPIYCVRIQHILLKAL